MQWIILLGHEVCAIGFEKNTCMSSFCQVAKSEWEPELYLWVNSRVVYKMGVRAQLSKSSVKLKRNYFQSKYTSAAVKIFSQIKEKLFPVKVYERSCQNLQSN